MPISGPAIIKVTPEVLIAKADEINRLVGDAQKNFNRIESLVNKTGSYWIGMAGDKHRKKYESKKDEIEEMLQRLKEHPRDLLVISGNYKEAENAAAAEAAALPDDVIF